MTELDWVSGVSKQEPVLGGSVHCQGEVIQRSKEQKPGEANV